VICSSDAPFCNHKLLNSLSHANILSANSKAFSFETKVGDSVSFLIVENQIFCNILSASHVTHSKFLLFLISLKNSFHFSDHFAISSLIHTQSNQPNTLLVVSSQSTASQSTTASPSGQPVGCFGVTLVTGVITSELSVIVLSSGVGDHTCPIDASIGAFAKGTLVPPGVMKNSSSFLFILVGHAAIIF